MCPYSRTTSLWSKLLSILSPCLPFLANFGIVANPLPAQDPFYHDTENSLLLTKPGTVLKSRKIELVSFPGLNQRQLQAWQILYRTTGQLGEPQCTVATIIVPPNHGDQIISYQSKTDSAFSSCRTSYSLRAGNNDPFGALSELVFMETLFDKNWIVIVPDYESSTDAFGAGKQSGQAVLDGIRAFLSSSILPSTMAKPKVALWGYSGGALASGWAASIQGDYAPELESVLVGAAIGGTPVDLRAIAYHTNGGIAAGLIVGCMRGLANAYPDFNQWLSQNLTAAGNPPFEIAKTKCFKEIMWKSKEDDVLGTYFKVQEPLKQDIPAFVLDEAVMGSPDCGVPRFPMLIAQSLNDEVVPFATVDDLVKRWVDRGANITYVRDELSAHVILAFTSIPASINFLRACLEGDDIGPSSTETVISIWADEVAHQQLGQKRASEVQDTKNQHYKNMAWWSGPQKEQLSPSQSK